MTLPPIYAVRWIEGQWIIIAPSDDPCRQVWQTIIPEPKQLTPATNYEEPDNEAP